MGSDVAATHPAVCTILYKMSTITPSPLLPTQLRSHRQASQPQWKPIIGGMLCKCLAVHSRFHSRRLCSLYQRGNLRLAREPNLYPEGIVLRFITRDVTFPGERQSPGPPRALRVLRRNRRVAGYGTVKPMVLTYRNVSLIFLLLQTK